MTDDIPPPVIIYSVIYFGCIAFKLLVIDPLMGWSLDPNSSTFTICIVTTIAVGFASVIVPQVIWLSYIIVRSIVVARIENKIRDLDEEVSVIMRLGIDTASKIGDINKDKESAIDMKVIERLGL